MRLSFRQGIINTQKLPKFIRYNSTTGFIDFDASVTPTSMSFADGGSNYTLVEAVSITSAWQLPVDSNQYWLYWDIDKESGLRTFGYTEYNPFLYTKPITPTLYQMIFNTQTMKYQEWNGQYWIDVLRVIAGHVSASRFVNPQSLGSQVGVLQSCISEMIVLDFKNKPIKKYTDVGYEFYNTATIINFKNDKANNYTFGQVVSANGTAGENLTKHYCVYISPNDGKLTHASYNIPLQPAFAIVEKNVVTDEVVSLHTHGFVINRTDWNWPYPANTPLFVGEQGELTITPNYDNSIQKIGSIISPNSIWINFNDQYNHYIPIHNIQPTPSPTPSLTSSPTPSPTPTLSITPTPVATTTPTPSLTSTPIQTTSISLNNSPCGTNLWFTELPDTVVNATITSVTYYNLTGGNSCAPTYVGATPNIDSVSYSLTYRSIDSGFSTGCIYDHFTLPISTIDDYEGFMTAYLTCATKIIVTIHDNDTNVDYISDYYVTVCC